MTGHRVKKLGDTEQQRHVHSHPTDAISWLHFPRDSRNHDGLGSATMGTYSFKTRWRPFENCLKSARRSQAERWRLSALDKLLPDRKTHTRQKVICIPWSQKAITFSENTKRSGNYLQATIHSGNVALALLWHWWNTSWSWRHDNMQTKSQTPIVRVRIDAF